MLELKDGKGRFVAGHKKVGGMPKGGHQTEEAKNKISASLIGRTAEQARRWKGGKASYQAKHIWARKHYGKPYKCEQKGCSYPKAVNKGKVVRSLKFRIWQPTGNYIYFELAKGNSFTFETTPHIEQYTGLKDKNGKEIYEGDIVRVARSYGYGFLPKGAKAKIEFDEKELCYKLRGQGEFRLTAKKELEVIGNIHENPDLLEDEE